MEKLRIQKTFYRFGTSQLPFRFDEGLQRKARQCLHCHYEERSNLTMQAVARPNKSIYFRHFNRKLLLTTLTLLNAIAAPAIIGLSRKPFIG